MKKAMLTDVIAVLFIFLFVYAASSKLMDYGKFRVQLSQSPLLTSFAGFVAWAVPSIEIFISIALARDKSRLAGLYAAFTMMTVFTLYIITITRFSEYIPCSCGGILSKMGWNQHLVFNLGFVLLAISGILLSDKHSIEINPPQIALK